MTPMDAVTTRTRTFSWSDPMTLATAGRARAGIDLLRAVMEGEMPKPPIADLVGAEIVAVEPGSVTFALEPAEWMYNPLGSVHGGIAATLLDSCMGCAAHTLLPAGVGYTTADLQVRYVKGMSVMSGRVLAIGRVVHPGKRFITVEGRLATEADDTLIAHGTSGCIVLR